MARTRQGLLAIRAGFQPETDLPPEIAGLLTEAQLATWRALPAIERAHLARVGRALCDKGETEHDLLIAAVLHDIGKHQRGGGVGLPVRVTRVLLDRAAPWLITRIRQSPRAAWPFRGLWLSVHHPRLGAESARALGCSDRACWLIAHHEDPVPVEDRDLAALRWADDRA